MLKLSGSAKHSFWEEVRHSHSSQLIVSLSGDPGKSERRNGYSVPAVLGTPSLLGTVGPLGANVVRFVSNLAHILSCIGYSIYSFLGSRSPFLEEKFCKRCFFGVVALSKPDTVAQRFIQNSAKTHDGLRIYMTVFETIHGPDYS
jgi:hypothetical protein